MATATATVHPDDLAVTLDHIVRQIDCGRRHPALIERTYRVLDQARVPDRRGVSPDLQRRLAAVALHNHTRDVLRYIPDPIGVRGALDEEVEKLADIEAIIRHQWADCDEHVIYLGSMLCVAAVPAEIWLSGRADEGIAHVWLLAYPSKDAPLAVDPTLKTEPAGTIPPGPGARPHPDHVYWRVTCL